MEAKTKATARAGAAAEDKEHREGALNAEYSKRPAIGEIVAVNGLPGRFEVVSTSDPSLIVLRNERGVELRVGERQVRRLEVGE